MDGSLGITGEVRYSTTADPKEPYGFKMRLQRILNPYSSPFIEMIHFNRYQEGFAGCNFIIKRYSPVEKLGFSLDGLL
jgi:hypothetical protein